MTVPHEKGELHFLHLFKIHQTLLFIFAILPTREREKN